MRFSLAAARFARRFRTSTNDEDQADDADDSEGDDQVVEGDATHDSADADDADLGDTATNINWLIDYTGADDAEAATHAYKAHLAKMNPVEMIDHAESIADQYTGAKTVARGVLNGLHTAMLDQEVEVYGQPVISTEAFDALPLSAAADVLRNRQAALDVVRPTKSTSAGRTVDPGTATDTQGVDGRNSDPRYIYDGGRPLDLPRPTTAAEASTGSTDATCRCHSDTQQADRTHDRIHADAALGVNYAGLGRTTRRQPKRDDSDDLSVPPRIATAPVDGDDTDNHGGGDRQ